MHEVFGQGGWGPALTRRGQARNEGPDGKSKPAKTVNSNVRLILSFFRKDVGWNMYILRYLRLTRIQKSRLL